MLILATALRRTRSRPASCLPQSTTHSPNQNTTCFYLAVDINGLPQAILVTRANVSDRPGALAMFSLASQNLELVQHVMVDGGYTGNDFADQVKLILNAKTTVAKRNELHMFTVLPQRWIVERSWSWLDKCRRLWKNCERALNSSLQMVVLAFLKIVLKRY